MKRVVVTGMALASPLGSKVDTAFSNLKKYKNCIEYWKELDEFENMNTRLAAPVKDFIVPEHFNRKVLRTMGKVAVYSTAITEEALKDAGLLNEDCISNGETGVSYGSSSGSLESIIDFYTMQVEKKVRCLNSGSYIKMMPQTTTVNISLYFKTKGRLIPSSTACTSGSMGIGYGYEAIKNGYQKIMITGGAEELHPSHIAIFDTLYATSLKNNTPKLTPSPFDKNRDGLVLGEGAGTLILEEYEHAKKRNAKIYAEIIGFGTSTDGTHITNPNPQTMGSALSLALKDAKISSEEIGYVNAHGTATIQGDIAESTATYEIFNRKVPISSLKSYTGHTLGACGAIEAILSIKMMNENWYAPTLNLTETDPSCADLDYISGQGRNLDTNIIMSNNFAFGGINTSLIFKKVD
ncbi:MAG: beta-ketoacyl-ACP synthase [Clostridium sp.]|nr:beta-ketoacyl-ACP synthase [Clostridium sp.]